MLGQYTGPGTSMQPSHKDVYTELTYRAEDYHPQQYFYQTSVFCFKPLIDLRYMTEPYYSLPDLFYLKTGNRTMLCDKGLKLTEDHLRDLCYLF